MRIRISSLRPPPRSALSYHYYHHHLLLDPRLLARSSSSTTSDRPPPSPYIFHPGHSAFAKRPHRPFPPPYTSAPASSFSDPLTTPSNRLSGYTNGDDALLIDSTHLGVADGVGAWNTKVHGHAALWSRLMLHFWSESTLHSPNGLYSETGVDPIACLSEAYESTISATTKPSRKGPGEDSWLGTTTTTLAVLAGEKLLITNLGDSVAYVMRPAKKEFVARTEEQWHWFDCPRQLGTNSPDRPGANAVVLEHVVEDGDVVVLASDGLPDNLWDHEVLKIVLEGVEEDDEERLYRDTGLRGDEGRMKRVARELVDAAKKVAMDPFAESPYMERSIEEGLGIEGGKWDDVSVVAAVCRLR